MKEKLDDSFLRHSRRIAKKHEGFKDVESTMKNKQAAEHEAFEEEEEVVEPIPLAIILGPSKNGAAPHLSKEIMEGITIGFHQIQLEAASIALLDQVNIDE